MAGWNQGGPRSTPMQSASNRTPQHSTRPTPPPAKVDPFANFGNFSSSPSTAVGPMGGSPAMGGGGQPSPQKQRQSPGFGAGRQQPMMSSQAQSPSHRPFQPQSQTMPQKTATPPPQAAKPNYFAGGFAASSVIGGREERGKRDGGKFKKITPTWHTCTCGRVQNIVSSMLLLNKDINVPDCYIESISPTRDWIRPQIKENDTFSVNYVYYSFLLSTWDTKQQNSLDLALIV